MEIFPPAPCTACARIWLFSRPPYFGSIFPLPPTPRRRGRRADRALVSSTVPLGIDRSNVYVSTAGLLGFGVTVSSLLSHVKLPDRRSIECRQPCRGRCCWLRLPRRSTWSRIVPAVREMFPPEPESGVIPIDRLEIPPEVPFTIVPDSRACG